jgi:hypothetical protein
MVKTIVDRSQSMSRLSPLFMLPAKALSIQWLNPAVSKQLRDDIMLAVLAEKPSKLFLLSAADAQHKGFLAFVPFSSSQGVTIACRNDTSKLDHDIGRVIHEGPRLPSLTLERLSNARLGPALEVGGLTGTTTVVNKVRERLGKLGTSWV